MAEISVIIPVVNEEKILPRLLDYLCKCDPDNKLEIIVVDGHSNDETQNIAEKCGTMLVRSEIRCRAHQMNLGAKKANTDVLYFVHADVVPPEDFINKVIAANEKGVQFAFFRQRFDRMNIFLWFNSFFTRFKRSWCRGGDQTVFVKKQLFDKLNGFDEKYVIMEEYDFMKRAESYTDYEILDGDTIVSSRKYSTNSWLKVMIANLIAVRQFKKGGEPKRIRENYINSLNPY